METRKLTVSGLVQRVGFRWSTMALANKMNIPGTVKNNSDGTVTIYLQSTPDKIDHFIEKLPSASGFAHIENIDQESVQNVEQMHDFHVLY
ncbi:Acylphosphatase [Lactobacillus helveticus CIRM-BIA 101]|uniref:acylphosphatase n=1 Tax=Lactobacillus helveticus TaxID=1587 RepID=A0AAV4E8A1_LACHE|nr:acylphosphatase [Lactobacillus helveticus]EGF36100.1 acylphosphatase [Lactobacillus helveticus MTCC 5463]AGQ23920.1 acylphosphate phosphohydrolase [Lactobacillus helveticus CNRZ32]EEW67166.1 acylphosphatase [Lactobacillus helveticus DSM 20075 = CGMCC 1.1877]KGL03698.1 acylphosphatase [Lactobacillus helveticus]KGL05361.1 acylphosphatase [Lactobacillus helveticus]